MQFNQGLIQWKPKHITVEQLVGKEPDASLTSWWRPKTQLKHESVLANMFYLPTEVMCSERFFTKIEVSKRKKLRQKKLFISPNNTTTKRENNTRREDAGPAHNGS